MVEWEFREQRARPERERGSSQHERANAVEEGTADLNINEAGIFLRVNVAAQRARQLMQGAAPKIATKSRKAAAIAIQEVELGLIEAFSPSEMPEALAEEAFGSSDSENNADE
jgi:DNA-directed RNA polymerase subunit K/omega